MICETPLHAGSGNDLGVIDLPIQRERHTSFPKIEGSSLKGSLREAFEDKHTDPDNRKKIHLAFGFDEKTPEDESIKNHFKNDNDKQFQGALGFTDARLLLFPVKSMKGVFAWITCKKVLEQFKRDMLVAKISVEKTVGNQPKHQLLDEIPTPSQDSALLSSENLIVNQKAAQDKKSIVLEEYSFKADRADDNVKLLALWLAEKIFPNPPDTPDKRSFWYNHLVDHLVVLPNEDFTDFVNLSTEVITRTKINNETGTVQEGALFTEEYLPSESVLYSLSLFSPIFHNKTVKSIFIEGKTQLKEESQSLFETRIVREFFETTIQQLQIVQIGGNATLGKGLVRTIVLGGQ